MLPSMVCRELLGAEKLNAVMDELSAPQLKSVLKEGRLKVKSRSGFIPQAQRRKLYGDKILTAIEASEEGVAGELLRQWLLHHRRSLLIAFLDLLEVKHRDGETDETFLVTCPKEKVLEAAEALLKDNDAQEVNAYLHYIAHQQQSGVFDDWSPSS